MADIPNIRDYLRRTETQPMAWYVTVVDKEGTRNDLKFPENEKWKALNCITQAMNAVEHASFVSMSLRLA